MTRNERREYIVLRHDDETAWMPLAPVEANDAIHAIRLTAAAHGDEGAGVYAAVPEHNWTVARVTVETEPRLRVETITTGEIS